MKLTSWADEVNFVARWSYIHFSGQLGRVITPLSHAGATATFHLFKPIRDKRGEIHLQASEEMKRYDTYTFSSKHKMTLIATYTCSWPENTSSIIPTKNIIFAGRTISTELQMTRQPTSRPLHHTAPHLSPWKLTDGFTPSPPASPTITEEAQMPWTIMTKTCTIFSRSHNLTKYSANSSRRAFISQPEEQSQLHFTRKQNDIRGKSNGVGIFLIKYLWFLGIF